MVGRNAELVEECADAAFDLVADGSDGGGVLAGGVGEVPVFVALAGEDRAGVAAAHDDDVGGADDLVGPGLGELAGLSRAKNRRSSDPAGVLGLLGEADLLPLNCGVPEGRDEDELVALPLAGLGELEVERLFLSGGSPCRRAGSSPR